MPDKAEMSIIDKGRDVDRQEEKIEYHQVPSTQNNGST